MQASSSKLPESDGEDRRGGSRNRTLLGGVIVSRDGSRTLDCTVRDLSSDGAKIRIPNAEVIPERAYLMIPPKGIIHEVVVSWIKRGEYGLKIVATYSRDQLEGGPLRFLVPMLVERMPRTG